MKVYLPGEGAGSVAVELAGKRGPETDPADPHKSGAGAVALHWRGRDREALGRGSYKDGPEQAALGSVN